MVGPLRLGMIGFSEGNGHPFSFSSIINGYSQDKAHWQNWDVIFNYLEKQPKSSIGIDSVAVTHIWAQDRELAEQVASAALIPTVCDQFEDMLDHVDGLILARDDAQSHFEIAKPFLEAGKFVFIDKPLSLVEEELSFFKPFLESGHLMSCSGFRYAQELDPIKRELDSFGPLVLTNATVLNDWSKYGIHMLEGIFGVARFEVDSVLALDTQRSSFHLKTKNNGDIIIHCLGVSPKTFSFEFWSRSKRFNCEVNDNFTAFKRTLESFVKMIRTSEPVIPPGETLGLMKILMAGDRSVREKREVKIEEIRF